MPRTSTDDSQRRWRALLLKSSLFLLSGGLSSKRKCCNYVQPLGPRCHCELPRIVKICGALVGAAGVLGCVLCPLTTSPAADSCQLDLSAIDEHWTSQCRGRITLPVTALVAFGPIWEGGGVGWGGALVMWIECGCGTVGPWRPLFAPGRFLIGTDPAFRRPFFFVLVSRPGIFGSLGGLV